MKICDIRECWKFAKAGSHFCEYHQPSDIKQISTVQSALSQTDQFSTGATRDTDVEKLDPEGFLSPIAILRFCQYMHRCRTLPDGSKRSSDNWQLGIPVKRYMKSLKRHVEELHLYHRGFWVKPTNPKDPQNVEEILCAIFFNTQGMLHEILKENRNKCESNSDIPDEPNPLLGHYPTKKVI